MEKQHMNETSHGGKPEHYAELMPSQEDLSLKSKELVFAMLHLSRLSARKRDAENETAQLSYELQIASNEAEELALKVEESNARAMTYKLKLQLLGNSVRIKEEQLFNHHREVLAELEDVDKQLAEHQLDMASALETKSKAEKEVEDCITKSRFYWTHIEKIKEEITIAFVEEALIKLARTDAVKESRQVEAQREAEVVQFRTSMEKTKKRINDLHQELNSAKELQKDLAVTASVINVLQNEIELIKAMDKNIRNNCLDSSLRSAEAELGTAKKELLSLKTRGFQLMAEMDAVREELQEVADEKEQSSSIRKESDTSLSHLNRKLHKAMSKLEAALLAEKRTEAIVFNVSAALQQLQTDIDAAKRDTQLFTEDTRAVRLEIEKDKGCNVWMEERLQAAMRELREVKASEAVALEKIRAITESTMSDRTISSLYSSTVTMSKFEYYYLIKQAKAAQEIADQKVAAAEAWIEALATEHEKGYISGKATKIEVTASEPDEKNVQPLNLKLATAMPRRSITVSGASGRAKIRRSSITSGRQPMVVSSATCLAASRRKKILLNLVKFPRGGK